MDTMAHPVEALLDPNTDLDRQIEIVSHLNQSQYHGECLFDLVQGFLAHARPVHNPYDQAIDIVGTGGDGYNTLNYSTLSALVLAHCGYPVIKHGNRSATGSCGSFDFLEKAGIDIPETPQQAEAQLRQRHMTFLFAPCFHPLFKRVAEVRRYFARKGEKTIFNLLGPLLNPATIKRMCVGVSEAALLAPYSEVLMARGIEYACIVYGNGFDEFSICDTSSVLFITRGHTREYTFDPGDYGYRLSDPADLQGGDAGRNYQEAAAILNGTLQGPKRDMLVINTAMAMYTAEAFTRNIADCLGDAEAIIGYRTVGILNDNY